MRSKCQRSRSRGYQVRCRRGSTDRSDCLGLLVQRCDDAGVFVLHTECDAKFIVFLFGHGFLCRGSSPIGVKFGMHRIVSRPTEKGLQPVRRTGTQCVPWGDGGPCSSHGGTLSCTSMNLFYRWAWASPIFRTGLLKFCGLYSQGRRNCGPFFFF